MTEHNRPAGSEDGSRSRQPRIPPPKAASVGPSLPGPLPASISIQTAGAERSATSPEDNQNMETETNLSKVNTYPFDHPHPTHASDYFSLTAQTSHSIHHHDDHDGPATPNARSPGAAQDSRRFVEAARSELYGNSTMVDAADRPGSFAANTSQHSSSVGTADTLRAFRKMSLWPGPVRSLTDYPRYPNQALSALHSQVYGQRRQPATNSRTISSSNGSLLTPHILPSHSRLQQDQATVRQMKSAGHTPAQTPGLFQPLYDHSTELVEERTYYPSPYPSPYLHPTQIQPPRTVTSADRQVDTFSGRKMINHYEIVDELGRGVHGKVKLARNLENGEQVAIKIVNRYSKKKRLGKIGAPEDKVKKEVAILKKAQHPNVVRLIEVIDDPDIAKVYIVLEFCELKEIIWRTRGDSDIVLAEHRRQELESMGVPEDVAHSRTESIRRAATRRRERDIKQRRLRATRRTQSDSDSRLWSLEYAGDTDEDDEEATSEASNPELAATTDDTQPVLRPMDGLGLFTDAPTMSVEAQQQMSPLEMSPSAEVNTSDVRPSSSADERNSHAEEAEFGTFGESSNAGYSFYGLEWYNDHATSVGARNKITQQPRQASITDSNVSQITELMESEVPEDYRFVPTLTLPECRLAFRDALVGLEYLHYHGIVHRDIKPENLLRTRDHHVKISDFGVSYLGKPIRHTSESADTSGSETTGVEEETELAKTVGTPAFYAPELCNLDLDSDAPVVTGQIDVWALGVTLFCLLFARTPFTAENEFALMKRVAEEDVFIPRSRLKAVDAHSNSRSPSAGVFLRNDQRKRDAWAHEPIDDVLYDLLIRLFRKNPKERITIKEIKHHPWVVRDIQNPSAWYEDTDPARLDQGKKIEISSEEVAEAVIPLKVVQRIKSITRRATSALGLGGRRKRGHSTASAETGAVRSIPERQDSETQSHDNPATGDSLFAGFRQNQQRDVEHPLPHSVQAGVKPDAVQDALGEPPVSSEAPAVGEANTQNALRRPGMPDRHASEISTSASIRTVRPSDYERGRQRSASPPSPSLERRASRPMSTEAPNPSSLSAVFGNASRNLLRLTSSRERTSTPSPSSSTTNPASPNPTERTDNPYGEPSVAVSNTLASGHVDQPSSSFKGKLRNTPGSSPALSRTASLAKLSSSPSMSRLSTPEVTESSARNIRSPVDMGGGLSSGARHYITSDQEPTDEEYNRAMEALSRRRALQEVQEQEHLNSSRPSTAVDEQACPPSPDDVNTGRNPSTFLPLQDDSIQASSSTSTTDSMLPLSATSSGDFLNSEASRSTSYPSVPSIHSAESLELAEGSLLKTNNSATTTSSEGTYRAADSGTLAQIHRKGSNLESDDGYAGDGDGNNESNFGVDSDEDESSGSEDGFLVMTRRKSNTHSSRSGSVTVSRRDRNRDSHLLTPRGTSRSTSSNASKMPRTPSTSGRG